MSDESGSASHEVVQEWVLVQKKSFTKLINRFIKVEAEQIQDLGLDFKDGKKLLLTLKYVLQTTVPEPERGKSRLHFVNTVNKAISVMKQNNVKLVNVGAEEIVDGNLKMTLGMTWAIILHGFIDNINEGGASAKEGLLLWCQRKTADYKNVKIKDFSPSWKNGLAFCALIHAHRPDLLDYDSLSAATPSENLEKAFTIAQEQFDIPRIMEVEDIVGTAFPDDKSVMAYVSMYYHYFSKFQDVENSAKRLQKILDMNQENSKLIEDYELSSSDLLAWMKEKLPFLQDRCGENPGIDDIKRKYEELNTYKGSEKPHRADEKTKLESDYQGIQTKLNVQNRPQYIPAEELNPKFLDDFWKQNEKEEHDLLNWLDDTLRMLEKVQRLSTKFFYKCSKQEEWMQAIQSEVVAEKLHVEMGLSELFGLSKKFKATETESKLRERRNEDIKIAKDELEQLKYKEFACVEARYEEIMQQWTTVQAKIKDYSEILIDFTARAQKLDDYRIDFSAIATSIKIWLDDAMENYGDEYKPRELKEISEGKLQHETFTQTISAEWEQIEKLKQIQADIDSISSMPNPYTSITSAQLESRIAELEDLCKKRTQILDEEHEKATTSLALTEEFEKLASEMNEWKKSFMERVSKTMMDKTVTLESKKELLQAYHTEIETYLSENVTKLDESSEKIKELAGLNWERAANTALNVTSGFNTAIRSITSMVSEIDNQITLRDSSGLSDKELEEINDAFAKFAKEDKSALSRMEFLNCLISIGFNLQFDDTGENVEFTEILAIVDPLGTGKITQSALIAYVTSQRKCADSAAEITESFKSMAKGKLYIMPDEIRAALAPKHAEDVIKQMSPSEIEGAPPGALDYCSYAEKIFGESDV